MWDATSSQRTLNLMTYVAIVFVPIILAYTSWCYWKDVWPHHARRHRKEYPLAVLR
ncbi:cytochrome d ubiquinol oxidase subunit II [Klebsiella pneumoniae]|uniref:Cytochrome d ubiquinol oxidase subunit II n=1 Tax=Klebsiella pneumoniae TaxID=573 RepID=A0A2X3EUB6_KLEPN|nr:cytochrome d ubiquinol oxidase subunit II [Klebsiella pneumoniae]